MVPVGTPPLPVTATVTVAALLTVAVLLLRDRAVCVAACCTVWFKTAETLAALLLSPE